MRPATHQYAYSYDRANRLLSGISDGDHGEILTYDKMGNINSLERTGLTSIAGASGTFVYDYGNSGNQLQSFTNGSSYTRNFQYNGQGSVVADGQMKMAYNELNLPKEITDYNNNLKVGYLYDARGRKLTKQSPLETRHYINGIEYIQNGTGAAIDLIHTEEGIARNSGGTYHYEYFLKDHLGNTRIVYNNVGTVLQQTDYYPFGMEVNRKITSLKMNYTYNGKELQQEIDQYDYGARFYDPVVGRWSVIDPMAELLEMSSPYVYSLNSPVNFIDKDGELPIYINGNTSNDSERGDRSYWDAQLLRTIASSGIPNPGGQIHFVDGNRGRQAINGKYYVTNNRAIGATDRFLGGQMEAKKDFNKILSMLERDPKTNKIIEKIQIYTHSRGSAFGAGYTDVLLELIKNNADQFANPNNVIDYVLNLAPHQSHYIDASSASNSFSIDHNWDMLSGDDMGNNIGFKTNTKSGSPGVSHQNKTFTTEVGAFIKAYQKSKRDNRKLIDDFVNLMRSYGIKVTVN